MRLLNRSAGRLSRHRRGPLAGLLVLLLGLLLTGGLYTASSRPAQADETASSAEQVAKGRELFLVSCSFCHGQNGEGVRDRGRRPARPVAGRRRRRRRRLPGRHRPDADGPARRPGADASPRPSTTRRSPRSRRTSPRSAPARRSPTEGDYSLEGLTDEEREEAITRGGQIFLTNCTACHNFEGSGGAMPHGGYAPKIRGVEPQLHLRGHAHRPAGDADLLQRQPLPRREARRHRLPRLARGDARLRRLRPRRPRPGDRGPVRLARSASACWSASRSGSPPTRPARTRRRWTREHPARHRRPRRAAWTRTSPRATTCSPTRACRSTTGGRPTSTRRPRSAPSARSRRSSRCPRSARSCFVVSYFTDRRRRHDRRPRRPEPRPRPDASAGALLFIGIGIIQWARKLMADHEIVEMRHPAASSDEDRAATILAAQRRASRSPASAAARWCATRCSARSACSALPAVVAAARPRPDQRPGRREPAVPRLGPRAHGLGARACASSATSSAPRSARPTSRSATWSTPSPRRCSTATRTASRSRASSSRSRKSKGAVILVRMEPDEIIPGAGRENWSVDGILCYSKICTHVGCPISLYERTTHHLLCPCHQSTFDLADSAPGGLRPGRPAAAAAAAGGRRRGLPRGAGRLQRTGGTELLGAWLIMDTSKVANSNATTAATAPKPSKVGAVATWADERLGLATHGEEEAAQGLPGPLVLHARRDRAVELRRPAAHRRLPDAVVHAEHGRGPVQRLLRPAARRPHVRGVRLDPATSPSTSAAAC